MTGNKWPMSIIVTEPHVVIKSLKRRRQQFQFCCYVISSHEWRPSCLLDIHNMRFFPRNITRLSTSTRQNHSSLRQTYPSLIKQSRRAFSASVTMPFPKPSSDPPKHEMAYFPDMTISLPSESGDFRRVLWTGLYSQLVLMTVPAGGDIGDEVRLFHTLKNHN